MAFARRVAGQDAEDLGQEVMARALRYQDSFDPERPLLPWLRVALLRARIDRGREQARRAQEQPHLSEPQSPEPAPERANSERVLRLLESLAPMDARLIRGFHLEHRSVRELAAETGLAEGSVRSRLHRARRRLAAKSPGGDHHDHA
ncbi:MAG: RNA polymerase sigma-70 factor (ECF subfamily) [Planctomycetota bacterium]